MGFYACKKNNSSDNKNKYLTNYSVKKEIKIPNLSQEFKNTNAVDFLSKIKDLDMLNGTLSFLNETDTITFYKFKYKSSEKILVLYYFNKSDRFVPLNIEHTIDLSNNNKEKIILTDYNNTTLSIENYNNKSFVGFSSISDNLLNDKVSSKQKVMVAEFDEGESCYECINRTYQASVKKCEDDMLCDITCSLNIACKAIFALSAVAVCTSPADRPCSPIKRTYTTFE